MEDSPGGSGEAPEAHTPTLRAALLAIARLPGGPGLNGHCCASCPRRLGAQVSHQSKSPCCCSRRALQGTSVGQVVQQASGKKEL